MADKDGKSETITDSLTDWPTDWHGKVQGDVIASKNPGRDISGTKELPRMVLKQPDFHCPFRLLIFLDKHVCVLETQFFLQYLGNVKSIFLHIFCFFVKMRQNAYFSFFRYPISAVFCVGHTTWEPNGCEGQSQARPKGCQLEVRAPDGPWTSCYKVMGKRAKNWANTKV